ncbi:hypothetical protein UCRPA7_2274 [Phaeoacremonium minimum UCRPA7]|uniref:Uncharacterized protein n=1 Tax=Phaeoacremonium minimum (strain UCR-PA7) TaxID=1286976 RepID=R8BSB9_PHAM7|nr:hypothetical protein UCRPA7_2274 [Phaeoacremonium minimum UCRPA7]EOO02257.1 hypothetical protein UCRPA7_2274 [Phaeoacremonium minimum UCRPA7]
MDLAEHHLEKRLSADFSLDKAWNNEVLFSGSWINNDGGATEGVSLAITCVECYTKGVVTAKLTDKEIINPKVRLSFEGVEAYVDLRIAMSAGATYVVNLFTSNSPIGLGFPGLSVGVVFYVDLVFALTEEIDLEAGFYVKLADDAFLEASVFGGDITDHFFDGISSKSLPITVFTGKATFKADLRVRVQCGAEAELDIFGIGAGAEVGIYANLIEFVAVLDSTPDCALQSREWWDLNVGAYAHLDVVIDYKTIGPVPTVSTTLLTAPTLTQCWIQGPSPSETGAITATTLTTIAPPAYSATVSLLPSLSDSSAQETISSLTTIVFSGTGVTTPPPSTATGSAEQSSLPSSSFKYPISNSSTPAGTSTGDELITSTVYSTTTYTITSCAASVVNCPASYQKEIVVTQTIDLFTTVCPATASITAPANSTSASAAASSTATALPSSGAITVHVITDVIVLVPCESPVVETFVAPSTLSAPSVQHVTGTAIIANPSSTSTSTSTTLSLPYVGGGGGKEVFQWSNATASTYNQGTGKPSASLVQTTTVVSPLPTSGAADRALGGSFAGVVGVVAAALILF